MKLKSLVVIPARFSSTRLAAKPILKETGKYLVQYVYEAALKSVADKVVIATDHELIVQAANSFGGEAVLTDKNHRTGTDRVAEVALLFPEYDIVINLQGDEPEIHPQIINDLIAVQVHTKAFISTVCCPFSGSWYKECAKPSTTKVVLGKKIASVDHDIREAIYFSRALIPYYQANKQDLNADNTYYLHMGMYGFSQQSLAQYVSLPSGLLEKTESLEQLRAIEHGYTIACGVVNTASVGIDTPEDYAAFMERLTKR